MRSSPQDAATKPSADHQDLLLDLIASLPAWISQANSDMSMLSPEYQVLAIQRALRHHGIVAPITEIRIRNIGQGHDQDDDLDLLSATSAFVIGLSDEGMRCDAFGNQNINGVIHRAMEDAGWTTKSNAFHERRTDATQILQNIGAWDQQQMTELTQYLGSRVLVWRLEKDTAPAPSTVRPPRL